jgi:hypothetical protein
MDYYIYHIKGVKIGCTKRLQQRMREQKFNEWEVLEIHTDKETAGIRERELQIQYGYGKDNNVLYHQIDLVSNGKKVGKVWGKINGEQNVLNGHLDKIRTFESCQKGGLKHVESGHIQKIQKIGGKIGNNKENRLKASISLKKTIEEKGLNKAEKNPNAKLDWDKVNEIRELWNSPVKYSKAKLSRMFGISESMIRYIVTNKHWVSTTNK